MVNMGTLVIDSTPPAMTMSCVPDMTAWAAKWIACWLEPHCLSTVVPGTLRGRSEERTHDLAKLPAFSETWETQPKITSSTSLGSRVGTLLRREFRTAAPNVAG